MNNVLGIFTGDVTADDACMFVTEKHTFSDLVDGLTTHVQRHQDLSMYL